jgi:hypothetical protein
LLAGKGVDFIDSTDNLVNLTAAQAASLGSVAFVSGDVVSVLDTGANIGLLTAAQLGGLAASGVDQINASDNQLSLSVAQVNALGVVISAGDTAALVDTAVNIKAMTPTQFASLADKGIDMIDVSNDVISISVAQAAVLGSTYFAAADSVTLLDTAANVASLSSTQLSNLGKNGIDTIHYNGATNFNGDAFSDIILQNKADGNVFIWDMNGKSLVASGYFGWAAGADWVVKGSGDFDFNGYSDVLLQNTVSGSVYLWNKAAVPDSGSAINNTRASQGFVGWTPGADWKVKGVGDFNGDHKSDILLQQDNTGSCFVWEMNGTSLVGSGFLGWSPGKDWVAKGVGDFNADGYSDVLLQNAIDGSCFIWEVDGTKALNGAAALKDSGFIGWAPGVDWQAKGVGDFNGDGHSDVLLQNAKDGSCYIWELDGKTLVGNGFVGWPAGKDWQVKSTGDYNGDGKSDVLLQNSVDGSCYVWELNGTGTLVDHGFVGWAPGAGWQVLV